MLLWVDTQYNTYHMSLYATLIRHKKLTIPNYTSVHSSGVFWLSIQIIRFAFCFYSQLKAVNKLSYCGVKPAAVLAEIYTCFRDFSQSLLADVETVIWNKACFPFT